MQFAPVSLASQAARDNLLLPPSQKIHISVTDLTSAPETFANVNKSPGDHP
jgi:hypothetical protein